MAQSSWLFIVCSLPMAVLFAYSASVQLNDQDWYLWFPLYACATVVNLANWAITTAKSTVRLISKATLLLGIILFLKVIVEDATTVKAGLLSLDMSQRVVREKTGSGLVIISMILQLEASAKQLHSSAGHEQHIPRWVEFGMVALLGFSFGLPLVFFVILKGEMKFDNI